MEDRESHGDPEESQEQGIGGQGSFGQDARRWPATGVRPFAARCLAPQAGASPYLLLHHEYAVEALPVIPRIQDD